MSHNDDAYAAMLLTLALSPNREEYARPYSVQEFRRIEKLARENAGVGLGKLMDMDISGLMMSLGISEEESYRAFTLMHRGVQLSYALDNYALEGIDIVTQYDGEYPSRLERRLGEAAAPCFYRCGGAEALNRPAIAVVGISGVKTTQEVRQSVETLVDFAVENGYGIITGGELGVARLAAGLADRMGGTLVDVLGGGLRERLQDEDTARMIGEGRCALISLEHPDAMFTVSHAIARNKLLFALADAAFVFNTDGRRGEADALQSRSCDGIYAWEGFAGNASLISRGARPFGRLTPEGLGEALGHWSSARSEQLNMFDLLG